MNLTFRGQIVEEQIRNGEIYLFINIQKPFFYKGGQWYSLSDKLIDYAVQRNATIKANVGGNEFTTRPTKKGLREKKKRGEVEEVKSKFVGMQSWYRWLYKFENKSNLKLL